MRRLLLGSARFIGLFALLGAGAAGCTSDAAPGARAPDGGAEYIDFCTLPKPCQDIVLACHPKDDGTNKEINDCHETAHDKGTESACQAVRADCVAKCTAAPALEGGIPEKFGPCGDAGTDAGHH